jgi:hypothetical protein
MEVRLEQDGYKYNPSFKKDSLYTLMNLDSNESIEVEFKRFSRIDKYPIFELNKKDDFNFNGNLEIIKPRYKVERVSLVKALEDNISWYESTKPDIDRSVTDLVLKGLSINRGDIRNDDDLKYVLREIQIKFLDNDL